MEYRPPSATCAHIRKLLFLFIIKLAQQNCAPDSNNNDGIGIFSGQSVKNSININPFSIGYELCRSISSRSGKH